MLLSLIHIFTHQDRTDNSPYVNDAASYQNIIDQLNKEEHPQFLQLVTMQNHMTYDNWYFNNQFEQANVTENLNDYERGQINKMCIRDSRYPFPAVMSYWMSL